MDHPHEEMVAHTPYYLRVVSPEGEPARLDWLIDDALDGMPALVTAVGRVIDWIDEGDPDEEGRSWCVALGFERRHDGTVELVDLRLFNRGTVTAVGRAVDPAEHIAGVVARAMATLGAPVIATRDQLMDAVTTAMTTQFLVGMERDVRLTATTFTTEAYRTGLPAPPDGLTARLLRRLKIGALEAAARRKMAEEQRIVTALPPSWAKEAGRRPGRGGRDDLHYARIAAAYVTTHQAGSKRPVADVARLLHASPKTVSNALYKARERGLLTGGARGKAGGQLTSKAASVLQQANPTD